MNASLAAAIATADTEPLTAKEIAQGRYMRPIVESEKPNRWTWILTLDCTHQITTETDPRRMQGWTYCPVCMEAATES